MLSSQFSSVHEGFLSNTALLGSCFRGSCRASMEGSATSTEEVNFHGASYRSSMFKTLIADTSYLVRPITERGWTSSPARSTSLHSYRQQHLQSHERNDQADRSGRWTDAPAPETFMTTQGKGSFLLPNVRLKWSFDYTCKLKRKIPGSV